MSTPESNQVANHGYGVAADGMIRSLEAIGHSVSLNDPAAPVEISFCQPYLWNWSNPDAYHVGYVPWESTKVPDKWLPNMQAADEVWTTSRWCKMVFEKNGLENVRVYHHGIDTGPEGWQRKRRRPVDRPIRFLHMGEPAPRKGGQLVYDTFVDLFSGSKDATLTIKAHRYNTIRGPERFHEGNDGGIYLVEQDKHANITLITEDFDTFQLIDLVRRHDVLVYPSWGEGFGLIPLQAMATGMPVICPIQWAPYGHLLLPELQLPAQLQRSPWQEMHPGNMYEPDARALRSIMESCADPINYANLSVRAYARSFDVEAQFDWTKLTSDAFDHIFEKFA